MKVTENVGLEWCADDCRDGGGCTWSLIVWWCRALAAPCLNLAHCDIYYERIRQLITGDTEECGQGRVQRLTERRWRVTNYWRRHLTKKQRRYQLGLLYWFNHDVATTKKCTLYSHTKDLLACQHVGRTQLSKALRSFTTTIGFVSPLRNSTIVQYSSKLHPVVESYSLVWGSDRSVLSSELVWTS